MPTWPGRPWAIFLVTVAAALPACDGLAVPTPTPAPALLAPGKPTAAATRPPPATVGPPATIAAPGAVPPATATGAVVTIGGVPAPGGNPTVAVGTKTAPGGPPSAAVTPVAATPVAVAPASTVPATGPPAAAAPGGAPQAPVVTIEGTATATTVAVVAPATASPVAAAVAPAATPTPGATGPSPTAVVIGQVTPGAAPVTGTSPTGQPRSTYFGIGTWNTGFPIGIAERDHLKLTGAGLTQILVSWSTLESSEAYNDRYAASSGEFDSTAIAQIDDRIRQVVDGGFTPILLIAYPPPWAVVTEGTQGPLRPEKIGKFANFARRLAQRYSIRHGLRYLVLWPEPDHRGSIPAGCESRLSRHHRAWGDSPAQFAEMLKQTYPAIKAAAPNVNVIMGALAYDNFEASTSPGFNTGGHGCGAFNYRFFDDVLAAGAGSHFDAFAFDAYGVFGVGWEQQADANGAYDIAAKTNYLRARFPVIRSKEVFILESGIWSDDSVHLPVRMPDRSLGSVAPNQEWQAGYPGKLFARGLSVNLKGVVWYGIRDQANDQQRGLLDQSGQPKRSFRAYQQAATSLAGATFQATLAPRAVASGLPEGYVFRTSSGARLVVVWAVGDLAARARVTIDMPGGNVRAFDVVGGAVSGLQVSGDAVTLEVGHAPVYLLSG